MRSCLIALTVVLGMGPVIRAEPCVSGVPVGQRPGPYSAVVVVGPQRGTLHCYICETADRPAVIVFARKVSEPLGKLLQKLDQAQVDHKAVEFRSWVTLLHNDHLVIDREVSQFARKSGLRNVPIAVFEDVVGPPSYKLNRDAEITILMSVKQKVVHNFAFRAGELTDDRIAEIVKGIPDLLPKK